MLGVAEPIVRTHVQHILSKTRTSKQADLGPAGAVALSLHQKDMALRLVLGKRAF